MKNVKKILILALILSALMCVNAFAAEITEITDKAAGVTKAEPKTIADKGAVAVEFSYSGVTQGNMYLVMILEAEEDGSAPLRPTSSNILYVNQGTASDTTISFDNLYPSEVKESYIFLAGADVALSGNPLAKINLEQPGGSFTVEALGDSNAATYTVSADFKTLNVVNAEYACVVAYTDSARESYTRLAATANGDGYDFDLSALPEDAIIVIAVKGDITGDGKLAGIEITRIKAEQLGKTSAFTALQKLVADVNGDGEIKGIEVTQLKAAQLGKTILAW